MKEQLLAARKAGDKKKVELIKVILGEMERSPTKTADKTKIVMKLIEAAKSFPVPDLEEIRILESFLPRFMTREQIAAAIAGCAVIKDAMAAVKAYATENSIAVDGKTVKEVFDARNS